MSTDPDTNRRRAPAVGTLVGAGLVTAGALLAATVDMLFLLLLAAGAFGPGVLRELGLLRDQDELQRQAARSAGYRAYLVGGTVAAALVAFDRRGTTNVDTDPALAACLVLLVLLVVWLLSALLGFWGARRAVALSLVAFGSFWLLFVVLSHLTEPLVLLVELVVAAPFFLLAWTAGRWPRATGVVLLALALLAFVQFDLHEAFVELSGGGMVVVLLFLPLVASGVALLRAGAEPEGD